MHFNKKVPYFKHQLRAGGHFPKSSVLPSQAQICWHKFVGIQTVQKLPPDSHKAPTPAPSSKVPLKPTPPTAPTRPNKICYPTPFLLLKSTFTYPHRLTLPQPYIAPPEHQAHLPRLPIILHSLKCTPHVPLISCIQWILWLAQTPRFTNFRTPH